MKKNLFYYLFAVLCTVTLFASCSSNEEPGTPGGGSSTLVENVVGTYQGDLSVSIAGTDPILQEAKIFMEQSGEDMVKLSLRNFSIVIGDAPVSVGDIVVEGIALEGEASNVILKKTSITMQHPTLQQLDITVSGKVANGLAQLRIDVLQVALNLNIAVTFDGERVSTEVDHTDYGKLAAAWYARTNLTVEGLPTDFELTWPSGGIEFTYVGFNKIAIPSFYLSFPPSEIPVEVAEVTVDVDAEGAIVLSEVKQQVGNDQKGYADMVMSGTIKENTLTLNIALKSETTEATYVYTGSKQLTGNEMTSVSVTGESVMVAPEIGAEINDYDYGTYTPVVFFVKPGTTDLNFAPEFTVSEGATMTIGDKEYVKGTKLDFSEVQVIKVVSQKGTSRTYRMEAREWIDYSDTFIQNFDGEWVDVQGISGGAYKEPTKGWATSNGGVDYLKAFGLYTGDFVVTKEENAARITTIDTKGVNMGVLSVPKVTSGTVFNGVFKVNAIETLKSTQFGYPCTEEPKSFGGKYKYTPGEVYYLCADPSKAHAAEADPSKTDAPAINAVLYEVNAYAFDYLDGTNLLTSENIVAIASVKDAGIQDAYTDFSVEFEWKNGKSWDATKKYKLAIVCSSSKDGDKFSGAPGSVLYIDDLKVSF